MTASFGPAGPPARTMRNPAALDPGMPALDRGLDRRRVGDRREPDRTAPPRVAIVGPCASGKTTLVLGLRAVGVDARSVAQEHSQVPSLYRRNGFEVLVYLDVSYLQVVRRREVSWGPERLRDEAVRLREARRAADLVLDTDGRSAMQVLSTVRVYLETWQKRPNRDP